MCVRAFLVNRANQQRGEPPQKRHFRFSLSGGDGGGGASGVTCSFLFSAEGFWLAGLISRGLGGSGCGSSHVRPPRDMSLTLSPTLRPLEAPSMVLSLPLLSRTLILLPAMRVTVSAHASPDKTTTDAMAIVITRRFFISVPPPFTTSEFTAPPADTTRARSSTFDNAGEF